MSAIPAIHVGLKQLGIAEEDGRDLYERCTGERSLKAMTPGQHQAVLDELVRLGFKPVSKGARKRLEGKYAPKLQALWIAGWNLGIIRDRSDKAMLAFVRRQTGLDHMRFLHHADDARAAIEALKKWLARDGGVRWRLSAHEPAWMTAPGYRIARAQFAILKQTDPAFAAVPSLGRWLLSAGLPPPHETDKRGWIAAMNALGEKVRAAK